MDMFGQRLRTKPELRKALKRVCFAPYKLIDYIARLKSVQLSSQAQTSELSSSETYLVYLMMANQGITIWSLRFF